MEAWVNPAGDAARFELVVEAAAGRIRRAGAKGPACGTARLGGGSAILSRGCVSYSQPVVYLIGSGDTGRVLLRRTTRSGVSPRGPCG